jgi:hypothetical protein
MIEIAYDTGIINAPDSDVTGYKKRDSDSGFNFGVDKKDNDLFGGFSFSITAPFASDDMGMSHATPLGPIPPSEGSEEIEEEDEEEVEEEEEEEVDLVVPTPRKVERIRIVEPVMEVKKKVVKHPGRLRQRSLRDPSIMTIVRHIPSSKKILEEREERRVNGVVTSADKYERKKGGVNPETLLKDLRGWGKQSQVLPKKVRARG